MMEGMAWVANGGYAALSSALVIRFGVGHCTEGSGYQELANRSCRIRRAFGPLRDHSNFAIDHQYLGASGRSL